MAFGKLVRALVAGTFAGLSACGGGSDASLRLYALDCGNIEVLQLSVFQPGLGPDVVKNLAVSCYLVAHPTKGTFLFDTGVGDAYVGKGKTLIQGFANFSAQKSLADQLTAIGYPPDSISYIAMSHLHLDHTGNSKLFPKATHLIQNEEFAAGFESADPVWLLGDVSLTTSLRNNPVHKLQGDFDVFGDGSVVIKRTVGHTPGHQSVLVRLPHSGNIVLSGDVTHYTDNWVNHVVPGFNYDQAASLQSILDVERLLIAENAVLWIGHDLEQNAHIRHAPAFYD
jgi:glyoxylase-like metal-dependent hydrolase (beta-lactamase superfamily II)